MHQPQYNEKDLLLQVANGNEQAFRQLFDTYRQKLYTYLLKMSDSKETAEDNVHDIFLKIWTNRSTLPDIQNLNAYLYRMAHNHAFNGLRKMATESLVLAAIQQGGTAQPEEPDMSFGRKEVRRFIHEAVTQLTPKQREVFLLSREFGLKQEEIAQRLGISILTVKAHLTDALNYLRTEITTHYGTYSVAVLVLWNLGS